MDKCNCKDGFSCFIRTTKFEALEKQYVPESLRDIIDADVDKSTGRINLSEKDRRNFDKQCKHL